MDTRTPINLDLYLVTDRKLSLGMPLHKVVEKAVKGGVTIVQLREKYLNTNNFIEEALEIKKILDFHGVPLVINDRTDIALAVGASGVHLGRNDMPCHLARKLMGPDKIIGLSVETFEQAEEANQHDVDYIAISPVFVTATKKELTNGLGIDGVKKISEISRHPAVAIGSIKMYNAAKVIQAGADGIAVVSAICSARDPEKAARKLIEEVRKGKNKTPCFM